MERGCSQSVPQPWVGKKQKKQRKNKIYNRVWKNNQPVTGNGAISPEHYSATQDSPHAEGAAQTAGDSSSASIDTTITTTAAGASGGSPATAAATASDSAMEFSQLRVESISENATAGLQAHLVI